MTTPFPMLGAEPLAGSTSLEKALAYHERSKHHPHGYALGPGSLDWANQPDPFRRYAGAPVTPLPFTASDVDVPYLDLFRPSAIAPRPFDVESLGAFFELSLGLSAWKSVGASSWALRNNPSSGNLHPTEGYLLAHAIPGIPDGVHHYASHEHALEHRASTALPLPEGAFLVGLSSVFWREVWKYGERAFRYCNHDAGHAIAALWIAGAALGWRVTLLESPGDGDVSSLLGLSRAEDYEGAEREHPDGVLLVRTGESAEVDIDALLEVIDGADWRGTANRLSDETRAWPVIDEAAAATRKPRTKPLPSLSLSAADRGEDAEALSAVAVIRKRRSAQMFDGRTGLTRESFLRIVDQIGARAGSPFSALPWEPLIHPVLMVHRVAGIAPGLYACVRSGDRLDALKQAMDPAFRWETVHTSPGITLALLMEGDAKGASRTISCHQEIASDGMFTLGMLADFRSTLAERGAWWYRRLFWEAGVLGQALYLEAEAMGVRGTGIGCYFDDAFHDILGLSGDTFQSMYHFTVGMPLEDTRLQTHPPYAHIRR